MSKQSPHDSEAALQRLLIVRRELGRPCKEKSRVCVINDVVGMGKKYDGTVVIIGICGGGIEGCVL